MLFPGSGCNPERHFCNADFTKNSLDKGPIWGILADIKIWAGLGLASANLGISNDAKLTLPFARPVPVDVEVLPAPKRASRETFCLPLRCFRTFALHV